VRAPLLGYLIEDSETVWWGFAWLFEKMRGRSSATWSDSRRRKLGWPDLRRRKLDCLEKVRKGWERRISCHMFSHVFNVPMHSQLTSL
jgi:hypothetical protein